MSEERDATIVAKALAPIYAPAAVNALARIEARLSQAEEERDAANELLKRWNTHDRLSVYREHYDPSIVRDTYAYLDQTPPRNQEGRR